MLSYVFIFRHCESKCMMGNLLPHCILGLILQLKGDCYDKQV